MAFPTVSAPVKSPSLDEFGPPTIVDPASGNTVPLMGVVFPDANGATTLPTAGGTVVPIPASQVTGKKQAPQVGTSKIPTFGLVGVDPTTGAPIPFKPASATTADTATLATTATTATQATKVTGKFQSAVRTATGASESIAHGLGVVPTLVLISIYDTNGVAVPYAMAEGVHTITNVLVTVTADVKYKVVAFA